MKILIMLILCFCSLALADDFKTVEGKQYKNVLVSRVEPDGIVLTTSSGISKVYFTELPKDVQERFHYDQAKSAAYSAEQNASQELLRKQYDQQRASAAEALASRQAIASRQVAVAVSPAATPIPPRQSQELATAKAQTEVMETEMRGDHYGAELARIKADYEPRIRAAAQSGDQQLADELNKQAKMKIQQALARRLLQGK